MTNGNGNGNGKSDTGSSTQTRFDHIIIAIHGIGEQSRYSTVQSVANRLSQSQPLYTGASQRPVARQPLGYFHPEVKDLTSVRMADDAGTLESSLLGKIGFAEAYWADIPREVVNEGRTLEETKVWARTVAARAKALCMRARKDDQSIVPPDFGLAVEMLDEVIETVFVLQNLTFLAEKAGLFKFDLDGVLNDYLGDVQVVTEFSEYRDRIVNNFHRVMHDVYQQQKAIGNTDVKLHIVAHSEGTVVSFLGLLQAMSGQGQVNATATTTKPAAEGTNGATFPEWLEKVHGYMTFGAPIDKHLLLWPRMWKTLQPDKANGVLTKQQIKWRNYYDFGDPVGFKLDTARRWLEMKNADGFQFCGCPKCQHDIGFARYILPGKAHTDYWNDHALFEDFICNVVMDPPNKERNTPKTKKTVWVVSPVIPYLISFSLLVTAVYILYKVVTAFSHPSLDPLEKYVRFTLLGVKPSHGTSGWVVLKNAVGIAGLLAGTTFLARFPRLAAGYIWKAVLVFVVGATCYLGVVEPASQLELGSVFEQYGIYSQLLGIVVLAALVAVCGCLFSCRPTAETENRQLRWFRKGMRPLLFCGALATALIVISQTDPGVFGNGLKVTPSERKVNPEAIAVMESARFTRDEFDDVMTATNRTAKMQALIQAEPVLTIHPRVWPVALASAGFLYLWWLATLIFDLSFVWHRYIRRSVAVDRMAAWATDLPKKWKGGNPIEKCRYETKN